MNHRRSLPLPFTGLGGDEDPKITDNDEQDVEEYPGSRVSLSNLKAALVGYNPFVGDTLGDGPDPGMKMQIFEVSSFHKVCLKILRFLPSAWKTKLHLLLLPGFTVTGT